MAASFIVHSFLIFFTFFAFSASFFVPKIVVTASSKPQTRYGVQLIHRDSPFSPFYDPKSTLTDRANWAFESSISRYAYLSMKQNTTAYGTHMDELKPIVAPDFFDYLAKLSIGTPPVDIYTVVDTASELLWTQCEPCFRCFTQPVPIFDPKKSSTYSNVSCEAPFCKFLRYKLCKPTCIYHYIYVDGSESMGLVGNEVLTFKSSDGSIATLPNVTFGCGFYNKMQAQGHQTGVLGLAAAEVSLIYHQSLSSPKFSYCVGNLSDPSSVGNLILGEEAYTAGTSTPMEQKGLYYVKLLDISVGQQRLNIPVGTFELSPEGMGGVYLDSGSKMTFLPMKAYTRVVTALADELKKFQRDPVPDPEGEDKLCFRGSISQDLIGFPDVTFHFDGDADMVLEEWSIFVPVTLNVFCMAFLRAGPGGLTVIGSIAQQFYNFGYDLVNNVLSFQLVDCSRIKL
ncbi:Peptidase A1 [Macleaya cordata]|uniref:Peptidase A1 n=1 Tax=Macleaya cordata TaxID=56857 RepID=A0A200QTR0_MACCD|nr:Peptidase A1 [Macleaya cordata]